MAKHRYLKRYCQVLYGSTGRRCLQPARSPARGVWYCETHARLVYLGMVEGDLYLPDEGQVERYRQGAFQARAWARLTRVKRIPPHLVWLLPRSPRRVG